MSGPIPPSPVPPWHRPTVNHLTEVLTEDDDGATISLVRDTTYLSTDVLKDPETEPYEVTLPDGNHARQVKRIYVPGDIYQDTAPWKVIGTFAGFGWLEFTSIGTSAVLEWDGHAWHLIGGNAEPKS